MTDVFQPRSDFLRVMQERGFIHQCSDFAGLDEKARSGSLVAYIGFDCTADSLHIGHMIQLMTLRRLQQAGYRLGPIVVNRVHPEASETMPPGWLADAGVGGGAAQDRVPGQVDGLALLAWLGERDRLGLVELARLLGSEQPVVELPLRADEPTDLASLADLGATLEERLADRRLPARREA